MGDNLAALARHRPQVGSMTHRIHRFVATPSGPITPRALWAHGSRSDRFVNDRELVDPRRHVTPPDLRSLRPRAAYGAPTVVGVTRGIPSTAWRAARERRAAGPFFRTS